MRILKIELKSTGKALVARLAATPLRLQIEKALEKNKNVVIDFDGIDFATEHFLDEFLAKLIWKFKLEEIREKLDFQNTRQRLKQQITMAFNHRKKEELLGPKS